MKGRTRLRHTSFGSPAAPSSCRSATPPDEEGRACSIWSGTDYVDCCSNSSSATTPFHHKCYCVGITLVVRIGGNQAYLPVSLLEVNATCTLERGNENAVRYNRVRYKRKTALTLCLAALAARCIPPSGCSVDSSTSSFPIPLLVTPQRKQH